MDSENEFSALESVEDNEAISPKMIVQRDDNGMLNNGSYANDSEVSVGNVHDREILLEHTKGEDDGTGNLPSPTLSATPDGGSPSNRKGVGLKKWRRIRRDHVKDVNPFADSSKMLKRGLATSTNNQSKPQLSSPDTKKQSEGSIGSENTHRNFGIPHSLAVPISIPDSRFAVGSVIAGDSDSEDRGSKFSTAASGPKTRQPRPVREKSRINTAARSLGSLVLQFQPGKGRSEGSKKLRGEKVKIEEENSLSSLESDSVNSNFVFSRGPFPASDNGKQGERAGDYGGENGDGAHKLEKQYTEEAERGNGKGVHGKNDGATEKIPESRDLDCLADSMLSLQSVQEALGREVEKLGTTGRKATPSDSSINDQISADHLDSQSSRQSSLGTQVLQMAENEKVLERKLEESTAILEAKELRITQLQAEISHSNSDGEVDDILKLKMEAEVEYLVLTRTMQTMKDALSGPAKLVEEQKALVEEQVGMIYKLGETESKAIMLEEKMKQLEEKMKQLEKNEDVEKMQSRVCKVTFCFLTELLLLLLVLWALVLQLLPEPVVIVPT